MNQKELIKERLNRVMLSDKIDGLETLLTVLKSDLKALLANYMTLDDDALKIGLEILPNNGYELGVKVVTNRLIEPGRMVR